MATLLASILVVGSASASDYVIQDPALAMIFPATHSALQQPIVTPAPAADEGAGVQQSSAITTIGQAIDVNELDELRGGDDVDNTVTIDGRVDNNTADRIVSGSNVIQDGAFANANGISTVIQNSGSNVLIQNGMVVTVQFADPGL
jgi:hypothetical protein